jgi:hypothetical protein
MDETAVREHAQQMCDALAAGDVDRAIADVSDELRRNLGEVLSLFPLPITEATIESIDRGGSALLVVLRLVGQSEEIQVQTRWKDRDGQPRIVEASHLSRTELAQAGEEGAVAEPEPEG